jgi:hypothetical protein
VTPWADPLHTTIGAVTFLIGVLVGLLLREAVSVIVDHLQRRGNAKGQTMATTDRHTVGRIGARRIGIILVTAALAVNACLGFLLITTRAAQEEQASQLADLVSCITEYNQDEGKARDERDQATKANTEVEAALWRRLRVVLTLPSSTVQEITAAIDEYLISVEELQATRYENPYPDPDRCARLEK